MQRSNRHPIPSHLISSHLISSHLTLVSNPLILCFLGLATPFCDVKFCPVRRQKKKHPEGPHLSGLWKSGLTCLTCCTTGTVRYCTLQSSCNTATTTLFWRSNVQNGSTDKYITPLLLLLIHVLSCACVETSCPLAPTTRTSTDL